MIRQGVPAEDITHSANKCGEPDFVLRDGRKYEVKRLTTDGIRFTSRQFAEFEKMNPTILVFSDDGENPVAVVPFYEVSNHFIIQTPAGKSIWISKKSYKTLIKIKTGLEKIRRVPVGFPDVISYLIEVTSIPAIPPDEDLIPKLERLRDIVRKRMKG